jgi:endonuclease YncB( thermonuclease family)
MPGEEPIAIRAPLLLVSLSFIAAQAMADTFSGRVVGISDGDTITVLDQAKKQHKVRLAGIDAPEKGQAFGDRAKESLSRLVFDKSVTVESHKADRYGRLVGKVLVAGRDANLEQVRAGFAWWYREYAKEQSPEDRAAYATAEEDARASRRGLWRDAKPVPPWEFRRLMAKSP